MNTISISRKDAHEIKRILSILNDRKVFEDSRILSAILAESVNVLNEALTDTSAITISRKD